MARKVRIHTNYIYKPIVERALGRPLPPNAVVHHVNEDRRDNRNENLVICENDKYHKFLHMRLRAYRACGHVNWKKCVHCKRWGPENEVIVSGRTYYHRQCAVNHVRKYGTRGRRGKLYLRCSVCDTKIYRDSTRSFKPCPRCGGSVNPVRQVQARTQGEILRRDNRLLTYNGITQSLAAWARQIGVSRHALSWRQERGWSTEEILTTRSRKGANS